MEAKQRAQEIIELAKRMEDSDDLEVRAASSCLHCIAGAMLTGHIIGLVDHMTPFMEAALVQVKAALRAENS